MRRLKKRFDDWSDAVWERIANVPWIRRVMSVAIALALSAYPAYVAWAFLVSRDFRPETWGQVIGLGLPWAAALVTFAVAMTAVGRRPQHALVALAPVIGAVPLLRWAWALSAEWSPKTVRVARRLELLRGLDETDMEVYRLRYDPEEKKFLSRRKTARRLQVSEERVIVAEQTIKSRLTAEASR